MSTHAGTQDIAAAASQDPSMALSTGAIAGIAVGGAVVLFAALAPLLIKLARKRNRQHASAFALPEEAIDETGIAADDVAPRRLRKKSIVSERAATMIVDKEDDDVGREEGGSRHSSLQISPQRLRQGSFTGSGRGSIDTQSQKTKSPDKELGYGMYQHRRKTSWIDEDALHGPTITTPKKTKQKHKRRVSWFDGGLGRSLSRLSTRSGMGDASPTLPYTESAVGQLDATMESAGEHNPGQATQGGQFNGYATPRQSQTYTSPQKAYLAITNPDPSPKSNSLTKSPPDIIHNPRYRNKVSFQAAQQLAGGARLPAPINIPQGQIPRPPVLKHSHTETELAQILRMTAERLQDGHRSSRRQTMMAPYHPGKIATGGMLPSQGGRTDFSDGSSDRGDISPVKSHKSAPATLSYAERAELEGCLPKSPQRQMQTPRHSRQPSHILRMSQVSMISEADSLVASKRESLSEVRTALSSPSRATRSAEPTPSPQGPEQEGRPFSNGSTLSSALSTLYSMEETSILSPPPNDMKPNGNPNRTPEKVLSAFGVFSANLGPAVDAKENSKFRLNEDEVPPPLQIRRGTLGMAPPGAFIPSRPASRQDRESVVPSKSRSSFAVHAPTENDDPFTAAITPKNPARLSKVFSPLPMSLHSGESSPKHTTGTGESVQTPTPSPTRRHVMPSPRTILNSPTSGFKRAPSPAISEAGLSSVYDSYTYSEAGTDSPEKVSDMSPIKLSHSRSGSGGRASRVGFRIPDYNQPSSPKQAGDGTIDPRQLHKNYEFIAWHPTSPPPPRRSMPSDGSVYSQDTTATVTATNNNNIVDSSEDQVPPLRAPTVVKRSKSVRMSNTITELRRMNSTLSIVSDQSVASPTLPVMRGGGFSPGRQSGGVKNYLALGGGLRGSGRFSQGSMNGGGSIAEAGTGTRTTPNSPLKRGSVGRARRSTVVLQGLEGKRASNEAKQTGQLVTQAAKLKREETTHVKRSSVESLYDNDGFLKGQPE
ncbi:hypothetical protein GGS26DRAFT_249423 [Hypomontagnella submonticulosa]|nr:hypothetical protein GGS26DRAFT_249423 [Hypomontagnella submonticulosa]